MSDDFFEGYEPLFELGLFEDEHPAVNVLSECEIDPVQLAALCVVLFDAVQRTVDESKQNEFEKIFKNSFDVLLEERFNYDVTLKYPEDDEEDDDSEEEK